MVLRRLLSILLLALFALPLASPLFALSKQVDGGLPACCRSHGKHHCMSMGERRQVAAHDAQFREAVEKCPVCPAATTAFHSDPFATAGAKTVSANLVSHPNGVAQTESRRRIARDRSRQKRGPPLVLLG